MRKTNEDSKGVHQSMVFNSIIGILHIIWLIVKEAPNGVKQNLTIPLRGKI